MTAQAIAKDFALEHRAIELTKDDFVNNAEIAVEATSGELLMSRVWGSYMFLQQVDYFHTYYRVRNYTGRALALYN